jgi:hypothetical protein
MSVSNMETIYTHAKRCGATGYIADRNRKAEVLLTLLTPADNGENIEQSMKFSWAKCEVFPTVQGLTGAHLQGAAGRLVLPTDC